MGVAETSNILPFVAQLSEKYEQRGVGLILRIYIDSLSIVKKVNKKECASGHTRHGPNNSSAVSGRRHVEDVVVYMGYHGHRAGHCHHLGFHLDFSLPLLVGVSQPRRA